LRHQSTSDFIRVLVSDDTRVHTELLADALKRDGSLQVTTSPSGSEGLIGRSDLHNVDVLLISSTLDGQPGRGFEVLRGLHSSHVDLPAVMLVDSSAREMIVEAFRAGARGVFSKQESVDTLSKCLRRVHEGQIWANNQQTALLVEALSSSHHVRAVNAQGANLLSKREAEIVRSVAQGLTNREIAEQLGLSPHTIKNCLFRVFDKLGVSNRVELLFMTMSQDIHGQSPLQYFLENHGNEHFHDEATLVACQQAAEQGVLVAQLALAQFYSADKNDPSNALHTYAWYSVAMERMSRAWKAVTNTMTVDEILQAEQMASNWLTKEGRRVASADAERPGDGPPRTGGAASSPQQVSQTATKAGSPGRVETTLGKMAG
jgi:two-component system, NarL family, nitrate/nitrite response regulator NarL